jgi:hypothetical protein
MEFHLTFDFGDDVLYAEQDWDERWLRQLVQEYAKRGISVLHWIHSHDIKAGLEARSARNRYSAFLRNVPDPLAVIADESHKNGMRCFSVLKINDRCLGMPFTPGPVAESVGDEASIDFLGGRAVMYTDWLRDHPEVRAELHPSLMEQQPRRPLGRIRLWHEHSGLSPSAFRIYTSRDNVNYRPYTGPQQISFSERKHRQRVFTPSPEVSYGPEGIFTCVEFSGLDIAEPFIAVEAQGATELANTLSALVELEDVAGNTVAFTYGLAPVMRDLLDQSQKDDWRKVGIAFDAAFGTNIPGRGWHYMSSGGRHRVDLKQRGFIGLARGRNRFLSGVLELAYPQARQYCVDSARVAIDSGCDGVDIRLNTHTESLDWENYGFGKPILDEFKRRYGVDIAKERFDRALWRKLRGEYVDQTLLEIGQMLHARGKKLSIQMYDDFEHPPEERCKMEIYFDWRKWCCGGFMDLATIAGFTWKGSFYGNAVTLCRSKNIPMVMTPAMFAAADEDWKRDLPIYLAACERDGFSAFNIYESSAVVRLEKDGLKFRSPSLWKMIKS